MEKITEKVHITDYSVYAKVLAGLLLLTTLTILFPYIGLTGMTVLVALAIASTKAGIVLAYFMHLRLEMPLFRILVSLVLLIYAAVIFLTFSDYVFR